MNACFSSLPLTIIVISLLGGCAVITKNADGSSTEVRIMDAPARVVVPVDYYDWRYYRNPRLRIDMVPAPRIHEMPPVSCWKEHRERRRCRY